MKFLLLGMTLLLNATTAFAQSPDEACKAKLTTVILSAAKLLGIKQEIGFEIGDTGKTETSSTGDVLEVYSTSLFFSDEGFITGSGATAAVLPTNNGCDLIKLNIHIH